MEKLLKKRNIVLLICTIICTTLFFVLFLKKDFVGYDNEINAFVIDSYDFVFEVETTDSQPHILVIDESGKEYTPKIEKSDDIYTVSIEQITEEAKITIELEDNTKFVNEEFNDKQFLDVITKKYYQTYAKSDSKINLNNIHYHHLEYENYKIVYGEDDVIDYVTLDESSSETPTVFLYPINSDAKFYIKDKDVKITIYYDLKEVDYSLKKEGNYYRISFPMKSNEYYYKIILDKPSFANYGLTTATSVIFFPTSKINSGQKLEASSEKCFQFSEYNLSKEPMAIITSYDVSCGTDVVIPDTIEGMKVFSIYDFAFFGCNLTSLKLSDNIAFIGDYSFANNYLEQVDFGKDIISIGKYAFYSNKIKNLVFPEELNKIYKYAFAENQLESVIFIGKSGVEFFTEDSFEPITTAEFYTIFDWKEKSNFIWD